MTSPLLTDLYQLSMGYGYWKHGRAETPAVFHLFYRRAPFGEAGTITCGIETAISYLASLKFTKEEGQYLQTLQGADGQPLFENAYIKYLEELEWELTVKAVPEGSLTFPQEPLMQIEGPLLQVQLIETALLNIVNFQTLIATKAARICEAAGGDPVMEFGLRRAQGPDGALSAARAAYIGGCVATSNVLAGMTYDIPVKGTHAHSWVMSYENEREAFQHYADVMPNNTLLLVDTYDTIEGVKNAITIGQQLRQKGHDLLGIRLDSGDLVTLSQKARILLDEAGFTQARIVASNDLDEEVILRLKAAGAQIDTWGVGTKLVTAYDQPALGGVYKLGAIQQSHSEHLPEAKKWKYRVKLSEEFEKISNPGKLQIWRQRGANGEILKDVLYNELEPPLQKSIEGAPLLEEVLKNGTRLHAPRSIHEVRAVAQTEWQKRPQKTCLELDPQLLETKQALLQKHGFTHNH